MNLKKTQTFELPEIVEDRFVRLSFENSRGTGICIESIHIFKPDKDFFCESHDDCEESEYCDTLGKCSDLKECPIWNDTIDGGDCPDFGGTIECSSHEQCEDGEYCNEQLRCESCYFCGAYLNSIDGVCPPCKPEDHRLLRLRKESCIGPRRRPFVSDFSGETEDAEACNVWDESWWCHIADDAYLIFDFIESRPIVKVQILSVNAVYVATSMEFSAGDTVDALEPIGDFLVDQEEELQVVFFSGETSARFWRIDFIRSASFAICVNDIEFFYIRDL
eukprot:TRINITY_DN1024_c0_g1_i1.p1 TRINITY_DN1024_c0_g1~~TRINITY_DN1024_c0_g1_i1.p1  ORF type:complete len:277 (+),score=39.43 TRINITY_DN1024_c0_g1_i1:506-1336(+)